MGNDATQDAKLRILRASPYARPYPPCACPTFASFARRNARRRHFLPSPPRLRPALASKTIEWADHPYPIILPRAAGLMPLLPRPKRRGLLREAAPPQSLRPFFSPQEGLSGGGRSDRKKAGRPSKLSPEVLGRLYAAIRQGNYLEDACARRDRLLHVQAVDDPRRGGGKRRIQRAL